MGKLSAFIKSPKGIVSLFLILIVLIAIPLTVFLVQNRQTLEQSAHTPQPTATAFCQGQEVIISYTYTITNLPTGVTANVSISDSQHFVTDSLTITKSSPPVSKQVSTGKPSIFAGVLTFQTTATDGFTKTNQSGYPAVGPCAAPTPTDTPIPTPTNTPIPLPSATLTNTPTPTPKCGTETTPACSPTLTITPTNTPTPLPSATPTNTPTPGLTNSPTPTDTPIPSVTPTIVITTSTPTPTPTAGVTDTPTPTIVTTATPTLLPTGPVGIINVGLIGIVLLIIGGLLIFAL